MRYVVLLYLLRELEILIPVTTKLIHFIFLLIDITYILLFKIINRYYSKKIKI